MWVGLNLPQVPRIFLYGPVEESVAQTLHERGDGYTLRKPLCMQDFQGVLQHILSVSTFSAQSATGGEQASSTESEVTPSSIGEGEFETSTSRLIQSLIGRNIGSFVIEEEIGRGGMGAVFSGRQASLDRKVAVKIMLPGLVGDSTAIERFRREALAIARLKSPFIVQVFDAGTTPDQIFYIAMEFLEGETLSTHLKRHKRYPLHFALHVAIQAAQGLQTAHQAGLIHRDIKPSNLMINSKEHITITDFGLVRGFEDNDEQHQLTQDRALLGTPSYLSPEQASGQPVDARSDIYSLGIVMYQMLVGRRPFLADNILALLMKQHSEPLPDPRKDLPNLPDSVVDLLYKMTAKDRDQRFTSCEELLKSLYAIYSQTGHQGEPESNALPRLTASLATFHPDSNSQSLGTGSLLVDSHFSSTPVPGGDILPVEVVKQLQEELIKHIGPFAKKKLKDEAKAIGFSRKQFPVQKVEELIHRISEDLADEQREEFQNAANLLVADFISIKK